MSYVCSQLLCGGRTEIRSVPQNGHFSRVDELVTGRTQLTHKEVAAPANLENLGVRQSVVLISFRAGKQNDREVGPATRACGAPAPMTFALIK